MIPICTFFQAQEPVGKEWSVWDCKCARAGGFSPFNVREHPKEEQSPCSSPVYRGRQRHSSSISKGQNCPEETPVAFYRLYREPQAHTGLYAYKLDGTKFEKNGSVSTALSRMRLPHPAAGTAPRTDELLVWAQEKGNWSMWGNAFVSKQEKAWLLTKYTNAFCALKNLL